MTTNKLYIGSALDRSKRWAWHKYKLNLNDHSNRHLQYAWNKYGSSAFEFKVIELIADKSKLVECEQFWIDLTRCCDPKIGYNIRKIAERNTGVVFSKEARAKISARFKGNKINLGRKHTDEAKAKMSLSRKGKPKSKDHVIKQALAQKGKKRLPHSEERKKNISIATRLALANKKKLWATLNGKSVEVLNEKDDV